MLLISFYVFSDLCLRFFHDVSIFEISYFWLKSNVGLSESIGIVVLFAFIMALFIPGLKLIVPLCIILLKSLLSKLLNFEIKLSSKKDFGPLFVKDEEIKLMAIESNNSPLWNAYNEHLSIKSDMLKQQTISQSILLFLVFEYFFLKKSIFTDFYNFCSLQDWYIDHFLKVVALCFIVFLFGIGIVDLEHQNYMSYKFKESAKKRL